MRASEYITIVLIAVIVVLFMDTLADHDWYAKCPEQLRPVIPAAVFAVAVVAGAATVLKFRNTRYSTYTAASSAPPVEAESDF